MFVLANVAVSNESKRLEKANMLLLFTKEAPKKDCSLKTQLLLSTNSQYTEKNKWWAGLEEGWIFFVERFSFNIKKKNIPKNALCLYHIRYRGGFFSVIKWMVKNQLPYILQLKKGSLMWLFPHVSKSIFMRL